MLIQPSHPEISITRQCDLIALSRSSYYYQTVGESAYNLELMRIVGEQPEVDTRAAERQREHDPMDHGKFLAAALGKQQQAAA